MGPLEEQPVSRRRSNGDGERQRSPGEAGELDWPELTGSRFSERLCFFKM